MSKAITFIPSGDPCARLMLIAIHAIRCQDLASQDVGMAECQDSSQLRVTDTGDIDEDVGPFITVANRSPVSRREAVLQVFRQHRNTSEVYRPATNGRRRLP
ncbi:hypothetical protein ANTRET_LOCUS153 [Anthophora retusa]